MAHNGLTALVPLWPNWHATSLLPEVCRSGAISWHQPKARASSLPIADFKNLGWLPKGKQDQNPAVLKSPVEHTSFFPPWVSPETWGHGTREQTLNTPLAAALEIAWQVLGVILWVRWTKDTVWQILGLGSWTRQAPKATHSSWHTKELLSVVTRNSKTKGLSWALCFESELGLDFFKYFGVQRLKWGQRDSHYLKFL